MVDVGSSCDCLGNLGVIPHEDTLPSIPSCRRVLDSGGLYEKVELVLPNACDILTNVELIGCS